jgi:PKD repeat protein
MTFFSGGGRRATMLGALIGVLGALGLFAPTAGAVLVHVGHGQVAGVTPVRGVSPASIPGSFAKHRSGGSNFTPVGTLNYHGGAVMHGASPYLIFWDPANKIPVSQKALYERYLADSAADSGKATNVYSVSRQYTDTTGFADYQQVWDASHSITDTHAYPASGQCAQQNPNFTESACLFDSQLQAEISRLIAADGLPTGIGGNAPLYFVITPPDVSSCFDAPNQTICADNFYCAFHSNFTDGASTVLYADMPTVLAANDPKGCQYDQSAYNGTPVVQSPNANPIPDVTMKALSHEYAETITDPVNGGGWYDSSSGQENGDQCNFYNPTSDPANDGNPNAFTPTLGGTEAAGTLYNQSVNGNHYYIQSEWSNGGQNCRMNSTPSALTAAFTPPSTATPGTAASFDPTASSAAAGYSSTTWSWGDGTADRFNTGAPAPVSHTFASKGDYTVTLTLVDKYGNVSKTSHTVPVGPQPVAAFSFAPPTPQATAAVSFDGSASNEPGGSITGYSWDFGDGSTGTGQTTSHAYAAPGTYTVTLTVSDEAAQTNSTTHTVTVTHGPPVSSFTASTPNAPAGAPVAFDGSGSGEVGGTISSYAWSFGDGATGTGATTSHPYTKAGPYTVTLTVTDATGGTASSTKQVKISGVPKAQMAIVAGHGIAGVPFGFDGHQSSDTGSTLVSYSWTFGDGGTATGAAPSHTFKKTGKFSVTLTVTDASGSTAGVTQAIVVKAPSISKVKVKKGSKSEQLKVTLTGPGVLKLGSKKSTVGRPRTVTLKVKLSKAQRSTLKSKHKLTVRYRLTFLPIAGAKSHRTITIKLKSK